MLKKLIPDVGPRVSTALLLIRIATGIGFMMHGNPKLAAPMSWDDHYALLSGIPPILQLIITVAENLGGLLLVFGFLTPLWAFIYICDMLVVICAIKVPQGLPYVGTGGKSWEIEAHLLLAAIVLLICGPGRFSVDAAIVAWQERRSR
jgi:putative oxidoreductase